LKNPDNVLFIVIDQLRADCIFGALADKINLPNIKHLMNDSVSFKSHYSVANPCGPSRASLLTGQYAMNHRSVRNGTPLVKDCINIATQMRKLRYEPMLFGYTDTSLDPTSFHANDPAISTYEQVLPGFNEKLEMRFEESYPWRSHLKQQGYQTPDYTEFYHPITPTGAVPKIDDPAFYKAEHSDSAFLTDQTLNELSVRTDKPWFAHVTYIRPHPPLVAPSPYNSMYRDTDFPTAIRQENKADEASVHPFLDVQLQLMQQHKVVNGKFANADKDDPATARSLRAIYLALISEVDHQVGRLIDFLKQTDQYDSTLIVITADHGEMLGDHHLWGKQTIYDKAIHVPLIIRDPKKVAAHGSSVEQLTESVDVMPTILDWVGIDKMPKAINGRSLLPFLHNTPPKSWRTHIFFELDFAEPGVPTIWQQQLKLPLQQANVAILREAQYKLVHFNAHLAPLLFDLTADPDEMHNLANKPECMHILLSMTQKMLNHRMTHADRSLSDMCLSADGTINFQDDY
jgi:arylsulfatase A-like enzyme